MTSASVLDAASGRGVRRLCHFTPSLNLPHIIRDGYLRPTRDLHADVRACFEPTDLSRLDGHPDCVCCSIEYPNVYYLAQARARGRLRDFPDWTVLLLSTSLLDRPGALYSPRNAAAGGGSTLAEGTGGFERCYAASIPGAGGRTFLRGSQHLSPSPTDMQAEVLIPGPIGIEQVTGIVFQSETQAKSEVARLKIIELNLGSIPILIAPTLFDRDSLRVAIQGGRPPIEHEWNGEQNV